MAVHRLSPAEQVIARATPFAEAWRLQLSSSQIAPHIDRTDLASLFLYRVPLDVGEGCARSGALEPHPFDLHKCLTGRPFRADDADLVEAARLAKLRCVAQHVARCTGAEWAGVYRVVASDPEIYPTLTGSERTLLKEAYVGAASRPFFPLTPAFAAQSNNSTVGLTGDAVLIHDTKLLSTDTPYYTCDGHVRSELCAPVTDPATGTVLGIMDIEAFAPRFFTPDRVALVLDMCAQLADHRLFLSPT